MTQDGRSPFDDVTDLVGSMPALTHPSPSGGGDDGFGRLDEIVAWIASVQGKNNPVADRALVCVFASTRCGHAGQGGSADEMRAALDAFAAGSGPAHAICAAQGLGFKAFDLAIEVPAGDIAHEPALDEKGCVATMAFGMEALAGGIDLLALGEAGDAAEASAAAILSALGFGGPTDWLGRSNDRAGGGKESLAVTALRRHGTSGDPLRILAGLGGRDIAAMAGAILAARLQRVPVILDGTAPLAAAAVLQALDASALDGCLAGHLPVVPGAVRLIEQLGMRPALLNLGISVNGGVGAALAAGLVRAAVLARTSARLETPALAPA